MNRALLPEVRRTILDPLTILTILGLLGFYQFYGPRFLIFVASGIAAVGIWAVLHRRYDIAVPIQVFFLGTWAYNFFEGKPQSLLGIMFVFAILALYAFWRTFERPAITSLTSLHGVYLTLATLIVWEIAISIKLFWPVEPWSRTFLVVAALIFLQMAIKLRLHGTTTPRPLLWPLIVVAFLISVIVFSTPIPFG